MITIPRRGKERSSLVKPIPLYPEEKTATIAQLLGLDSEVLQGYLDLLDLQNISLNLNQHGDGYLVLFENPDTGELYQIDAGLYAQALTPIVGFSVRGEKEGFTQFLERENRAFQDLKQYDQKKSSLLPAFTLAYLKTIVDWASGETIRSSLNISEHDWEHITQALKFFHLKPVLIPHSGAYIFAFVDQEDTLQQLPKPFNSVGGFAFQRGPAGKALPVAPEFLDQLSQEYREITGLSLEMCRVLETPPPEIYQCPSIEWLTEEFLGMYFYQLDGSDTKDGRLTPTEEHEENSEAREKLAERLSPFLEKQGLRLIDARELMQPGYAEAMSQGIYKNMFRYPLADYLIVQKDTPVTELGYVNLLGWQKPHNGGADKPPSELIAYSNVCGIMVINPDMPVSERKKLTRYASQQIRRFFPSCRPKPIVATVDLPLIEQAWPSVASPLIEDLEETAANPTDSASRAAQKILNSRLGPDYGHYNINIDEEPTVIYDKYTPRGEHIGAAPSTLKVIRHKDLVSVVAFDFGLDFQFYPSWTGIGNFPTYNLGLNPWVGENEMFPWMRRFYRLDLLQNSINGSAVQEFASLLNKPSDHPDFYTKSEFFLTEIFHRLGEAQFTQFLLENARQETQSLMRSGKFLKLLQYSKEREQRLYKQLKIVYDIMLLSHNHQDHSVGIGLMREEIPLGMSALTRAQALNDFNRASNWLQQDVVAIRKRDLPKIGSSYQVVERPYLLFEDGERREVSPGVFITAYSVYHSIPGAMGFVVDVVHNGKHLVQFGYPGDYRDPRFFEKFGRHKLLKKELDSTLLRKTA